MPDSGHVELQPRILARQEELELAVFLRVRRQLIGSNRDRAPLEPLADIPGRLPAGPPRREMIELSTKLAEPLSANPFEPALLRAVTVDAGEVELPDLARGQPLTSLIRCFRRRAPDVDSDRRVGGEIT